MKHLKNQYCKFYSTGFSKTNLPSYYLHNQMTSFQWPPTFFPKLFSDLLLQFSSEFKSTDSTWETHWEGLTAWAFYSMWSGLCLIKCRGNLAVSFWPFSFWAETLALVPWMRKKWVRGKIKGFQKQVWIERGLIISTLPNSGVFLAPDTQLQVTCGKDLVVMRNYASKSTM